MRRATALMIVLAGSLVTAAVSVALHMPARDSLQLAGTAVVAALLAGAAGTGLMYALRRRSIGIQAAVVAATGVVAMGLGAVVAARGMFISSHDLHALLVILLAAGTAGALIAFLLSWRVAAAAGSIEAMARRIGRGEARAASAPPLTAEFARLSQELEEMAARLEEARARESAIDHSRRELIAWVSHDLRTPLAVLRAVSEALEDGVVEDPQTVARYHRTLRVETDRLAHLVDELFELSVIHSGALQLQMERVSLGDLVSDAVSAVRASADARRVQMQGRVNGSPPELELAPTEVYRVVRNLLDNAIRYTPSDGSVWVETGVQGELAYFSVADQCGGIPQGDLPRVFDTAFRGEPARTPGDGGAGLGLAIARGIVEAHRGQITVANEGSGCRFTVRLPLTQSS